MTLCADSLLVPLQGERGRPGPSGPPGFSGCPGPRGHKVSKSTGHLVFISYATV